MQAREMSGNIFVCFSEPKVSFARRKNSLWYLNTAGSPRSCTFMLKIMPEALKGHLRSSKCLVTTFLQASHWSELFVLKPSRAPHVVVLQPDADCPGSRADCLGLNSDCPCGQRQKRKHAALLMNRMTTHITGFAIIDEDEPLLIFKLRKTEGSLTLGTWERI